MELKEASARYLLPADQQIPKGYKQTEVGVIPEDWVVSKFGKHAAFKTGPFGSALHKSDYIDGGVPVINPMQIIDGKIQPTLSMAISEQAVRKLSDFCLSVGDVVIGRRGEMGRCAFVQQDQHGWLCGTGSMIVRVAYSLDARFIQRVLSSPSIVSAIENASVGTTMVNLNQGTLGNLLIALPPTKAEQEAIAEALSDADALIESLEQLITKKRQIKQGAMQELLTGKRHLPGFSGEWEIKRLSDLGNCIRGVSYRGDNDLLPHDTCGTTRLLRSNNVQKSSVVITDIQFVNSERVSEKQLLQEGDILICMANGSKALVGKAGHFQIADGNKYTFGAFMGCFRTTSCEANSSFVFYLFQTRRYRNYINNLLAGSSINNLTPSSIESLDFSIPALSEQTAIATILSDMDTEIAALETKLAKAHAIKQGMMQQLLTGRIRLV